jgi:putative transcriptional regulator
MRSTKKTTDLEVQNFHRDLLHSVKQMKTGKAARKSRVKVPAVVAARNKSGLSQPQFAELLGISVRTLQKWEQGEREPSGAAKSLIRIAQRHPEVLLDAIK